MQEAQHAQQQRDTSAVMQEGGGTPRMCYQSRAIAACGRNTVFHTSRSLHGAGCFTPHERCVVQDASHLTIAVWCRMLHTSRSLCGAGCFTPHDCCVVQEAQRAQQQKDAEAAARGKKAKLARIREKYGDQVGARLLPPMHGPFRPFAPSNVLYATPPPDKPLQG